MQLDTAARHALASHVKAHLKNNNLSMNAFAESSGINNNTISRLTHPNKTHLVQGATQAKLAKALGMKWKDIIAPNGNGHAAERQAREEQAPIKARRMLVIELGESRIFIPSGVEVSIIDASTIRVR